MREEDYIRSPDTKRKQRLPPGQRKTGNWPLLHYSSVPIIDISRWTFTIFGLVKKEIKLSYQEFISLPQVKVLSDVHCVTGWSKLDNLWEGVRSNTIKGLIHILPEAKFVMVHAADGYTTNLLLSDFFEKDVLFAIKHNGELLTPEHGGPVRLVVPRLYFWKSGKWVIGVEFISENKLGLWESRGYHHRGDPWKEERYG